MTNQTISETNHVETTPLTIIHILGWELDNDPEQELWPSLGFSCFDISSNPELEPHEIIKELEADINTAIESGHNVGLVGHSIGGYYAAYVAEKHKLPAVLINPLIKAYDSLLLASTLEDSPNLALIKTQLQELETATSQPDSIMVMLQTGDKLQDYQQAIDYYQDCKQIVLDGGSHRFDGLADWVTDITDFFNRYYE